MTATVSVVIPMYQGARFIAAALESIVAQSVTAAEVLVIDDGSDDDGPAIAERHGARVIPSPRKGVAAARNAGIERASGDVIALLDQDDVWLPGKLQAQLEALERTPEALCYTRQRFFLEPGAELPKWFGKPELMERDHDGYAPSCLAFRRDTWLRVGPFDETLMQASDTDWYARARSMGLPTGIVPETLVLRRIHESNDSGSATVTQELLIAARRAAMRARSGNR